MKRLLLVGVLLCVASFAFAGSQASQTVTINVSAVHEIAIQGSAPAFTVVAPATPGNPPKLDAALGDGVAAEKSGGYLNYTCIPTSAATNVIAMSATADPAGFALSSQASVINASGQGQVGTIQGYKVCDTGGNIVAGIGGCWTGSAATDGARLQYKLELNNAEWGAAPISGSPTVVVTYTLQD